MFSILNLRASVEKQFSTHIGRGYIKGSKFLLQIRPTIDYFAENSVSHRDHINHLYTVVSTISLRATSSSFKKGKMKLRCLAEIFDMYSQSHEVEFMEDTPQVALIMIPLDRNSGKNFSSLWTFI